MAFTFHSYPHGICAPPFDKWIRFDAMTGRHILKRATLAEMNAADTIAASVILYLSESTMKNSLGVHWETADLGALIGEATDMLARSGQELYRMGAAAAAVEKLSSTMSPIGVLKALIGAAPTATAAVIADLSKALVPTVAQSGQQLFGTKVNPRTDVLFDSAQYREFTMEWALIPRTKQEADEINAIVQFFQHYMLPKYSVNTSDFLIGYPYEFEIGIYQSPTPTTAQKIRSVGQIGRSVVTAVSVDHAGGGKVAFIEDGTPEVVYPAATNLSVSFQEVRLLDRTDFANASGVVNITDEPQYQGVSSETNTLRRTAAKPNDPRGDV